MILELEGIRQAATVHLNGVLIGSYEAGVTPFGFDLTGEVVFGADNVLAICADNTKWRPKAAAFQWDTVPKLIGQGRPIRASRTA